MTKPKLIYFERCPNADNVQRNLAATGIDFDLIRQDDLAAEDPLRQYTSPTILWNGEVLFGAKTGESSGGCSLEVPTAEDILRKLREIMDAQGGSKHQERSYWYRRVLFLSWFTVIYNVVEGLVSVYFGIDDSSVSLFAFGADSFVEVASALVILWRFQGEQGRGEHLSKARESHALKAIGALFLVLAFATVIGAAAQIVARKHPENTLPGILVSAISLSFMYWLYRAKVRAGEALGSRSVLSDAACSRACIWLSVVLLLGSLVYGVAPSLYWADAAAAIGIAALIGKEGREMLAEAKDKFCCGCG